MFQYVIIKIKSGLPTIIKTIILTDLVNVYIYIMSMQLKLL